MPRQAAMVSVNSCLSSGASTRSCADWQASADERLKSAEVLAQHRSFTQAADELNQALTVLARPRQWVDRARSALESVRKTRVSLESRLSKLAAPTKDLLAWPEKLVAAVELKLLSDDGSTGLTDAQRLAKSIPKIEKLLATRDEANSCAASARLAAKVAELRPKLEEADVKLREGDTALEAERLGDARRLYQAAREAFVTAAARLLPYVEGQVAEGETEVLHDHCDTALEHLEPAVALIADQKSSAAEKNGPSNPHWPAPLVQRAHLARAQAYAGRGEYEKALADCEEALRIEPQNARSHLVRAAVRLQQGAIEKVLADCQTAGQLDQANALLGPRIKIRAMIDSAIVAGWGGDGDPQVLAAAEKALQQLVPKTAMDYADRGWIWGWMARKFVYKKDMPAKDKYAENARSDFTEALRLDPKLARVHASRAQFIDGYDYRLAPYDAKDQRRAIRQETIKQADAAVQLSPRRR